MNHATKFAGKQKSCGISNAFSKTIWLNLVLLTRIYSFLGNSVNQISWLLTKLSDQILHCFSCNLRIHCTN